MGDQRSNPWEPIIQHYVKTDRGVYLTEPDINDEVPRIKVPSEVWIKGTLRIKSMSLYVVDTIPKDGIPARFIKYRQYGNRISPDIKLTTTEGLVFLRMYQLFDKLLRSVNKRDADFR